MGDRLGIGPADVATMSPDMLPALLAELAALQTAVATRLAAAPGRNGDGSTNTEMLTAKQVAARLNLTPKQVYKRADRWPFTRRLSPGTVRFDRHGLDLYLGRQ